MKNKKSEINFGTKHPVEYEILERHFGDGQIKFFINELTYDLHFACFALSDRLLDESFDDINSAFNRVLELKEIDKPTTIVDEIVYTIKDGKLCKK
jgi:hypothetical protein